MSTRGTYHFTDNSGNIRATIYRHTDNYPEGAQDILRHFFDAVNEETGGDTRFSDPNYLAAKFVVFLARLYARDMEFVDGKPVYTENPGSLKFLSVGVLTPDTEPGDIEYRYYIRCGGSFFDTPEPTVAGEPTPFGGHADPDPTVQTYVSVDDLLTNMGEARHAEEV